MKTKQSLATLSVCILSALSIPVVIIPNLAVAQNKLPSVRFTQAQSHVKKKSDSNRANRALQLFRTQLNELGTPQVVNGILFFGNRGANGDYALVNAVTTKTGAVASIFVKSGDDFIRVSTNLTADNTSAVATLLNRESPAYTALSTGQSFFGSVNLFGNQFDAGYEPIVDSSGNIVGALFVGFPN